MEVTNVWQGVRERTGTRRAVRTRPGGSTATSPGASTMSARLFCTHTLATTRKRTRPQRCVRNASRNPSSVHPTRRHVCTEPGTDLCRDTEDPVPASRGGRADAGSRNERPTGSTRGQQAPAGVCGTGKLLQRCCGDTEGSAGLLLSDVRDPGASGPRGTRRPQGTGWGADRTRQRIPRFGGNKWAPTGVPRHRESRPQLRHEQRATGPRPERDRHGRKLSAGTRDERVSLAPEPRRQTPHAGRGAPLAPEGGPRQLHVSTVCREMPSNEGTEPNGGNVSV